MGPVPLMMSGYQCRRVPGLKKELGDDVRSYRQRTDSCPSSCVGQATLIALIYIRARS